MQIALRMLRHPFILAGSLVALSFTPAAAQPAEVDPQVMPGCYEVTTELPDGLEVSFCLTADFGESFTVRGPEDYLCQRTLYWSPQPDGVTPIDWPADFIHININSLFVSCPDAAEVLTDDMYCGALPDGSLDCTFDEERYIPARQVTTRRID